MCKHIIEISMLSSWRKCTFKRINQNSSCLKFVGMKSVTWTNWHLVKKNPEYGAQSTNNQLAPTYFSVKEIVHKMLTLFEKSGFRAYKFWINVPSCDEFHFWFTYLCLLLNENWSELHFYFPTFDAFRTKTKIFAAVSLGTKDEK